MLLSLTMTAWMSLLPAAPSEAELAQLAAAVCEGADTDAERAERLVAAAAEVGDSPEARNYFYRRAVACGMTSPAGYRHAQAALDRLAELLPDEADRWRAQKLEIMRRRYRAARGAEKKAAGEELVKTLMEKADALVDAGQSAAAISLYREALPVATYLRLPEKQQIIDTVSRVRKQAAAEEKARVLAAQLKENPDDTAVRTRLIEYCVFELDRPGRAAQYLNDDVPLKMTLVVPYAARPIAEVAPADCKEVGTWYYEHRRKVSAAGRLTCLERALAYFERYRDAGTLEGVELVKTKMLIDTIRDELAKLGGSLLPAGAVAVVTFDKHTLGRKGETLFARDLSGNNNHAVLRSVQVATGVAGEAVDVGGKHFINTRIPHTPAPKTVVFWAQCKKKNAVGAMLFGHNYRTAPGDRFYLAYRSGTGNLSLGLGSAAWGNETSITADTEWHHYAIVWNGSTMGLYYDAKPVATKKGTTAGGGVYYLGASHTKKDRASGTWPGLVDEFAFFDRVLKPAEVRRIFELGKQGRSLKR